VCAAPGQPAWGSYGWVRSERGWGGVGRRLDVAGGEVAGEKGDALLERVDGVSEKLVEAALARLTVGGVGGVCQLLLQAKEVGLVRLELGLESGEFGLEVGDELAGETEAEELEVVDASGDAACA
jgi:hypothetical protein